MNCGRYSWQKTQLTEDKWKHKTQNDKLQHYTEGNLWNFSKIIFLFILIIVIF